jgi:thioredoxin 1
MDLLIHHHDKETYMSDLVRSVTDDSFADDVAKAETPVLLVFGANGNDPWRRMLPLLDEAAKAYDRRLQIMTMDVESNRDIPAHFGIRKIPTSMVFKGGELATTKVGALSLTEISEFVDANL